MTRHIDDDINALRENLLKMASLAEQSIDKSIEALKNRDQFLAEEVIRNDREIDELENLIEEQANDLLALQQPMAVDFRYVTKAIKINQELERIADISVNIAQRVLELAEYPLLKPLVDIPKLAQIARTMVKDAIEAFLNEDAKLAKNVILSDTESDQLRNLVQQELIYDYMVKDGKTAPRAVPLLLVARHLERICDHATYIAEEVIYILKGKSVKHHPEQLNGDDAPA